MEIEFRVTSHYQYCLVQHFSRYEAEKIAEKINRAAQLYITDRTSFHRFARRLNRDLQLRNVETSVHRIKVGRNIIAVFAIDEDPIFEQLQVTLLSVFRHKDFEKELRSVRSQLYGDSTPPSEAL